MIPVDPHLAAIVKLLARAAVAEFREELQDQQSPAPAKREAPADVEPKKRR